MRRRPHDEVSPGHTVCLSRAKAITFELGGYAAKAVRLAVNAGTPNGAYELGQSLEFFRSGFVNKSLAAR